MHAANFVEAAAGYAEYLERQKASQINETLTVAREAAARDAGLSPGTFLNVRLRRLKQVGAHVYECLRLAAERELTAEMRRLEQQLTLTKAARIALPHAEVAKAEALLAEARQLLAGS